MARLMSDQKMGFYPTPITSLHLIARWMTFETTRKLNKCHILDPCCGEGEALSHIAGWHGSSTTWGVETDVERVQAAADNGLDNVLQSSIFDVRINPLETMGLLYLNPPYDSEDGERMEMKFLRHSIKWLAPGGVLCFIVPEHIFERKDDREWIAQHFTDITVKRIHREDFPAYQQVVLFGVKRSKRVESADIPCPPYQHIEDCRCKEYPVPATEGPTVFQTSGGVTPEEISKYRENSIKAIMGLVKNKEIRAVKPITLVRKGHLVALLSGGLLNGKIHDTNGDFIVVKGYSSRITSVATEDDKEITRDTYSIGIRVMSKEKKKWKWEDIR